MAEDKDQRPEEDEETSGPGGFMTLGFVRGQKNLHSPTSWPLSDRFIPHSAGYADLSKDPEIPSEVSQSSDPEPTNG